MDRRRDWIALVAFLVLAGGLASACAPAAAPGETPAARIGSVEVLGLWGGSELASFQATAAPWEQSTGGKMSFTGTRDLIAILTARVSVGNPPDIAVLPNPGQMVELARSGKLVPLDSFLDMDRIGRDYARSWLDAGSVDGKLYAIFVRAADKAIVWHNPKVFVKNGWQAPVTWDELMALSDRIVAEKKPPPAPWSVGIESGQATGWPGTDWIAQILLSEMGGDVYDQWVAHKIPWTDPRIKAAFERFGKIVFTPGYVPGGATAVQATNFQDASLLPFQEPPRAAMHYEGNFVQGFISAQFPILVPGDDYSFFPFPVIKPEFKGAATGAGDLIVVFRDTPAVRSFVDYLSGAKAQEVWVRRGGFISVNKSVDVSAYPDILARKAAEQLGSATLFRFGAGDSMPSAVQKAWWDGIVAYLRSPSQLDSILATIEAQAASAYK